MTNYESLHPACALYFVSHLDKIICQIDVSNLNNMRQQM